MLITLAVVALLAVSWCAPASAASDDLSNACPEAPPGWTAPPSNPRIWGPTQNPGTTQESVNCWYLTAQQKTVLVTAQFALPSDLNPYGDFVYGCGPKGAVKWDTNTRQYRITSTDRWLYVGFNDAAEKALSESDEKTFEGIAKTLLKNTEAAAHGCSVRTVPTATKAGWLFDFEFSVSGDGFVAFGGIGTHTAQEIGAAALPDGTFTTVGGAKNPRVKTIKAPPVHISIVDHGTRRSVTVRIVAGLSYKYEVVGNGQVAAATLKTRIRVTKSSEPTCHAGSTGTLTLVSAPARVSLTLCGSLFRHPSRRSSVRIMEN